jgi:hypothetical protein
MNPRGLTHRRSPTTSGVERSPAGSSAAKPDALKDNMKKETIKKMTILFIYDLPRYIIFALKLRTLSQTTINLINVPSILHQT